MEIQEYYYQQRRIYELIMRYLLSDDESNILEEIFQLQNISEDEEELRTFLLLISKITEHYHRSPNFYNKIKNILIQYSDQIKQSLNKTLTNLEIFKIFENNKLILYFLFELQIINPDESILDFIQKKSSILKSQKTQNDNKKQRYNYDAYFYPEIKSLITEEESKLIEEKIDGYIKSDKALFDEKRRIGENDNYLCELIRQDSIEEFVSYVNHENIPLSIKIKPSIFETNKFLIENEPTLIEYASFFGSIQIFQYLFTNQVALTPSLWLYSIHSNNAEMIQILELNKVAPPGNNFQQCLKESIKCHHNSIVEYIKNNKIDEEEEKQFQVENNFQDNLISYSYEYYNYHYITNNIKNEIEFYYLSEFGYYKLVTLYLKYKSGDLSTQNIQKALHYAAVNDHQKIIKLLINQKDIKVDYETFSGCSSLSSIEIPSSITNIADSVFSNCSSLENVFIPSSVKSIGFNAFRECSSLKSIEIPSSVTCIADGTFYNCSSLKNVVIPSSVIRIGLNAFYNCSSLISIKIPSSVTSIDENSFNGCSSLTNIEIPSSLKSLGSYSFRGCTSLKSIEIPSSVKIIRSYTFRDCKSLKTVIFPSSLEFIEDGSFSGCSSLASVEIPSSVISIGNNAFNECTLLISINIPPSVDCIKDGTFSKCSSLKGIEIPSSVKSIGCNAFSECKSIEQIEIPSSVVYIDFRAFAGCSSLTSVIIPSSVSRIGDFAFDSCPALNYIEIPSSINFEKIGVCPTANVKKI